jgi:hypothetical protein
MSPQEREHSFLLVFLMERNKMGKVIKPLLIKSLAHFREGEKREIFRQSEIHRRGIIPN